MKNPSFLLKKSTSKKSQKTNDRFGFPTPDYLWSNFIENNFFREKPFFFAKKINLKKISKNKRQIRIHRPRLPLVKLYRTQIFSWKTLLFYYKNQPQKNLKKLTTDSDSPPPITFCQTVSWCEWLSFDWFIACWFLIGLDKQTNFIAFLGSI